MTGEEIEAKRPRMVEQTNQNQQQASTAGDVGDGASLPPSHCAHWVVRKKRYCKMTVAKGRNYCGEHEPATNTDATNDAVASESAERIVCPLDGKHTVYKKNLHKHLKICNARVRDDEPPYVVKNINVCDSDDDDAGEAVDDTLSEQIKLHELDDKEFYSVIDKVKELYAKYVAGTIATMHCTHQSLDSELANATYGKETQKHLIQTAALLGVLEAEQQLRGSTNFIEFGAGKGQLAYYLATHLQAAQHENSQVILIDRMSLRHKKDNKIEDRSLVQRIRVDIADFHMERLELLQQQSQQQQQQPRLVAISKHLCGGATDLALRCITRCNKAASTDALQTEFIMIALCCHHRCDWRTFVGKRFCRTHGISQRALVIITKMVGWAICGTGMSRERRRALAEAAAEQEEEEEEGKKVKTNQRLPLAERERIGFMCKRVLDYARLLYLREHGYEAVLKEYVPQDVTLENVCLLARKITTTTTTTTTATSMPTKAPVEEEATTTQNESNTA